MRHKFDLQNLTILGGVAAIAIAGILLVTPPQKESLPVATPTPAGLQMDTLIHSTIAQRTYSPTPTALSLSYNYTAAEVNEATDRHGMNQRYCCTVADNGGESLDWTREKQAWNRLKISAKYHYRNAEYEWNRRDQHIATVERQAETAWSNAQVAWKWLIQ